MKASQFRDQTLEELQDRERDLSEQLFALRDLALILGWNRSPAETLDRIVHPGGLDRFSPCGRVLGIRHDQPPQHERNFLT